MQANPFIHWNNIQKVQSIPMVPSKTPLEYSRPAPSIVPMAVPGAYRDDVNEASKHSGMDPQKLSGQINAENGGNWSPTLKGRADPTDFGITQLNPMAVNVITGKAGPGRNYFKDNYGVDFDPKNASHQIKAMGVYLAYLKKFGLPGAGLSGSNSNAQLSYNVGAHGLAKAQAGDSEKAARALTYQNLLTSHGATSTN